MRMLAYGTTADNVDNVRLQNVFNILYELLMLHLGTSTRGGRMPQILLACSTWGNKEVSQVH
ncbi:unnamed protein product [Linum tenue]|uniref:Uncharacterized protein n=1 Tax=Linum tenue TaxID=586396 RepID=A0AAV0MTK4_9ROSI|nr:unnamed protein product [Linum tenue]